VPRQQRLPDLPLGSDLFSVLYLQLVGDLAQLRGGLHLLTINQDAGYGQQTGIPTSNAS
jgi:hypothetical protein